MADGGTFTGGGVITQGSNATFTATPDANYKIASINIMTGPNFSIKGASLMDQLDGQDLTQAQNVQLTNVQKDCKVLCRFELENPIVCDETQQNAREADNPDKSILTEQEQGEVKDDDEAQDAAINEEKARKELEEIEDEKRKAAQDAKSLRDLKQEEYDNETDPAKKEELKQQLDELNKDLKEAVREHDEAKQKTEEQKHKEDEAKGKASSGGSLPGGVEKVESIDNESSQSGGGKGLSPDEAAEMELLKNKPGYPGSLTPEEEERLTELRKKHRNIQRTGSKERYQKDLEEENRKTREKYDSVLSPHIRRAINEWKEKNNGQEPPPKVRAQIMRDAMKPEGEEAKAAAKERRDKRREKREKERASKGRGGSLTGPSAGGAGGFGGGGRNDRDVKKSDYDTADNPPADPVTVTLVPILCYIDLDKAAYDEGETIAAKIVTRNFCKLSEVKVNDVVATAILLPRDSTYLNGDPDLYAITVPNAPAAVKIEATCIEDAAAIAAGIEEDTVDPDVFDLAYERVYKDSAVGDYLGMLDCLIDGATYALEAGGTDNSLVDVLESGVVVVNGDISAKTQLDIKTAVTVDGVKTVKDFTVDLLDPPTLSIVVDQRIDELRQFESNFYPHEDPPNFAANNPDLSLPADWQSNTRIDGVR